MPGFLNPFIMFIEPKEQQYKRVVFVLFYTLYTSILHPNYSYKLYTFKTK